MQPDSISTSKRLETQDLRLPYGFDDLEDRPCWVAWQNELREAPNGKPGRKTKVPYRPRGGGKASSTDAATWGTYREAVARKKALKGTLGKGTGIILGDLDGTYGLGGIDLDSCWDGERWTDQWAKEVRKRFGTYAEVSPSGEGVKLFFLYRLADLDLLGGKMGKTFSRGEHEEIALYLGGRWFAVTDDQIGNEDFNIITRAKLKWLLDKAGPSYLKARKGDSDQDEDEDTSWGNGQTQDKSRSGKAYRLALRLLKDSPDSEIDDFEVALADDPDESLGAWLEEKGLPNKRRELHRTWEAALKSHEERLELSPDHDTIIRRFEQQHRDALVFDHSAGRWYRFEGGLWRPEETKLALHFAREASLGIAGTDPSKKALKSVPTWEAVERGARTVRSFAVTADQWDRDKMLLGSPGGTVDLRTGEFKAGDPLDYISKSAAATPLSLDRFDPEKDCPRWLDFLDEALGGDTDAIRFLQQWAGYSATGETREQKLLFVWGIGGTGKSTAINTIGDALGEYTGNVRSETLTAQKWEAHPEEVARLQGVRLAWASEIERGKRWNEKRLKELTGGDLVTARHMRENSFSFRPELKLTVIGNDRPALSTVDEAMRRRFLILPFERVPLKKDPKLPEKLRKEFPGILSWMIEGALDWQKNGLVLPPIVNSATAEYFDSEDIFAQWVQECCVTGKGEKATLSDLWESWEEFCFDNKEEPGTKMRSFPELLKQRGYAAHRTNKSMSYIGITIHRGMC